MGSGGDGMACEDDGIKSYLVADPVEVKASGFPAPESPLRYSMTGRAKGPRDLFPYSNDALRASRRCLKAVGVISEVSKQCGKNWKTREELLELDRPESELLAEWQRGMEDDLLTPLSALACESGALFLKLGQMCALKMAMAPAQTRAILEKCRDEALSVPIDAMLPVIERALGRPWDEVFALVERDAVGAASIAQAHRATLQSGEDVIIKIQHDKIAVKMRADLFILPVLQSILALGAPNLVSSMKPLLVLCREMVTQELDMRIEGYNRERLAAIFERSDFDGRHAHCNVVFPKVFWEWTAERVMVQELAVGAVSLNDVAAVEGAGVPYGVAVDAVLQFFCESVFVHGYTHNDMHPGNLMIRDASEPRTGALGAVRRALVAPGAVSRATARLFHVGLCSCGALSLALLWYWPLLWLAATAALVAKVGAAWEWKGKNLVFSYRLKKHNAHMRVCKRLSEWFAVLARVRFDLVVIDHGFHTHLPHGQRRAWCKAVAGTVLRDGALLREAAKDFGLGENDWKGLPQLFGGSVPYKWWKQGRLASPSPTSDDEEDPDDDFTDGDTMLNERMPKDFHLLNRAYGQIAALSALGYYGYGGDTVLYRMRITAAYALVGMDIADERNGDLPVPGSLKTVDGAWLGPRLAAARAKVDAAFDWKQGKAITYEDWDKFAHMADNFYKVVEEVVAKGKNDERREAATRCGACDNCRWTKAHPKDRKECAAPKDEDEVERVLREDRAKRKDAALKKRRDAKKAA